jgi:hypothetical protein
VRASHASREGTTTALDDEIARVRATIKTLDAQKQRALRLFTIAEADDADVQRELARLNKLHLQARSRLAELEGRRATAAQLEPMAEKVREYCALIRDRLDQLTFEQKREVLETLQAAFTLQKTASCEFYWYSRLLKTPVFILTCDVHRHVCYKIKVSNCWPRSCKRRDARHAGTRDLQPLPTV